MEDLSVRIAKALAIEEVRAERFASYARLMLLGILTVIALLNAKGLSLEANVMNFGTLAVGYAYGLLVSVLVRRKRYHPIVKYLTSCVDILLVMMVLFFYTSIEHPAVALKNYVFLVVFPLIALTALRYDLKLTLVTGLLALVLYVSLFVYLVGNDLVELTYTGYSDELFTPRVTLVGQVTKMLILAGYVGLVSYMSRYSRRLMERLVRQEVQVEGEKESIERELEVAAQVQDQLMPHTFPRVGSLQLFGKVEAGKFVGGDYCDFLKIGEDRLLVIVADVSGKGVPAALIMAEVRASVHILSALNLTLVEFVERLNILLCKSTERKTFVTFFVGEVNVSRSVLRYVNAGHPPPLLGRDGQLSPLSRGTIPLGVMSPLPQCTMHEERFPQGSYVVCYTDGILERRDSAGDEYGEENLTRSVQHRRSVSAESFVMGLLSDVRAFGGGSELDDDLTIAVLQWPETNG